MNCNPCSSEIIHSMFNRGVGSDEAKEVFDLVDTQLPKEVCQPLDPATCKRFDKIAGTVVRIVQENERD